MQAIVEFQCLPLSNFNEIYLDIWRDSSAREREVDLVLEYADRLDMYEIKASQTAKTKFADNMFSLERNAGGIKCDKTVVYDGPHNATINGAVFTNRRDVQY